MFDFHFENKEDRAKKSASMTYRNLPMISLSGRKRLNEMQKDDRRWRSGS